MRPRPRRALTLLELATFVAVTALLLGLMVSLARHVQSTTAQDLTRRRLERLAQAVEPSLARPMPIPEATLASEPALALWADESSRRLVEQVRSRLAGEAVSTDERDVDTIDADSIDPGPLDADRIDAWGMPIALAPGTAGPLGMAPDGQAFLVSPGPDRRYLTRGDNLYSYDLLRPPSSERVGE